MSWPEFFLSFGELLICPATILTIFRQEQLSKAEGRLGLGDAYGAMIERIKLQGEDRSVGRICLALLSR